MILPLLLLAGLSQVVPEVSRVPSSHTKSSVLCSLELKRSVREVYPEYNIVTGERFIAQIDPVSCSILSTQTHEASSCVDGSCSDQATSVVKVDDTTLYYCYTDNKSPKPMTATLQGDGTYVYSSGTLSDICLNDVTKSSYIALNAVDQLLYIATDSRIQNQLGFKIKYYDIPNSKSRSSPKLEETVTKIAGMFRRGDYLYTVYLDPDSKITRSCQKDSDHIEIQTFTVASLQCVNSINGVQVVLDRVLDLVYSSTLDKLFILATQAPVSSAAVALCVLDVALDVDNVFDTSQYYAFDQKGDEVKAPQEKIDCSNPKKYLTKCVDPVKTTKIAMTTKTTDVYSFAHYEPNGYHLLYLLGEDSLNVYEYKSETGKARSITDVVLWAKLSSISLYQDMLYLTSSESVFISEPYWCSYYRKDPVTCLGSMHPSCSYSKTQSRCLPTAQCSRPDACVQSLEEGSFSAVFPDGYSYTQLGTQCLNNMFYEDLSITYHPNTTVTTHKSYRDCSDRKPATDSPVKKQTSALLTNRELGFLIGMICCGALCILAVAVLIFRGTSRVNVCKERSPSPSARKTIAPPEKRHDHTTNTIQVVGICNGLDPFNTTVRYKTEDKRAIFTSSAPTTPDRDAVNPFSNNSNNSDSAHPSVIRNESAGADPLYDERAV